MHVHLQLRLHGARQEHADGDRERREWIELYNKAEGLTYSTERTLEEFAADIEDTDRSAVETALEKTKQAMAGNDAELLKQATDELSGVTYQMTERLYASLGGDEG